MPKRSKEDTEITINTIMDAVVEQILTLGYDKMSYTTLSKATGISRTGISHHFPKKTDFVKALDGRIFRLFLGYLDFDNGLPRFSESWLNSLNDPRFLAVLRLLFHHIAASESTHPFAGRGIERLFEMCAERFGDESKKELEWLFGRSLIDMSQSKLKASLSLQ